MTTRFVALSVMFALAPGLLTSAATRADEPLSLERARAFMVELINRDRATKDLVPVELDAVATTAAQGHADEMAANRYMSHYNLAGKPPNQRYTEAGGTGYSRENIYLSSSRYVGVSDDPESQFALVATPMFSRREIEEIESSYVNETPPHDGHRKNIFAAEHTHVGIGLSRAAGRSGKTLANAQEFVDKYVEAEPIPAGAQAGTQIRVAGRVLAGARLRSISVGHAALPEPLTREKATSILGYGVPAPDATYWPPPYRSKQPVRLSPDGTFVANVPVGGQAGLYYIGVWVEQNGRDLLASLRTVVVR
jgi:uncharacterized protein YkwD